VRGATIGERIAHAAGARGYQTAKALADAVTESGFEVTKQTMANVWANRTAPRDRLLVALEPIIGLTVEEMRFGPRDGDSLFCAELRGVEVDLTPEQQDTLLYLANKMAAETRTARAAEEARKQLAASLTDEELEWVRLLRAASPVERRDALAVAGAEIGQAPRHTELPQEAPRTQRSPRRSA